MNVDDNPFSDEEPVDINSLTEVSGSSTVVIGLEADSSPVPISESVDAIVVEITRYQIYCPACLKQAQWKTSGEIWGTPYEIASDEWFDFQVRGASGFTCANCNADVAIPRKWILKLNEHS